MEMTKYFIDSMVQTTYLVPDAKSNFTDSRVGACSV